MLQWFWGDRMMKRVGIVKSYQNWSNAGSSNSDDGEGGDGASTRSSSWVLWHES